MESKKSQSRHKAGTEDKEHLHFCNSRVNLDDQSIQISTDLLAEYQKLWKQYQNLKHERDMLRKALNAYHKSLNVQPIVSDNFL